MTTNSHAAPWTFRQFLADLFAKPTPRQPVVLSGREAAARHLFGESIQWSKLDMLEYDNSPALRGGWLAEADRRIAAPRLPLSEMFILRHWGYTPEQWTALPALVKVDKRESFYQAQGLAS
jgi:hypothetical protein